MQDDQKVMINTKCAICQQQCDREAGTWVLMQLNSFTSVLVTCKLLSGSFGCVCGKCMSLLQNRAADCMTAAQQFWQVCALSMREARRNNML